MFSVFNNYVRGVWGGVNDEKDHILKLPESRQNVTNNYY